MEEERVDQEEVWSAIRYLDPDEKDKDRTSNVATIIAVLALLIVVGAVGVLLWVRVFTAAQ